MALLYLDQKRYSEAESLFERVLDARHQVLGLEHPDTIAVLDSLGRLRLEQQRYADAEVVLRPALDSKKKKSTDTWDRYDTEAMLGASLAGQGRYSEAEQLLLTGYEGLRKRESTIPSPDRSALQHAGERIVRLYQDWGKPEEAAEWREKLRVH
jgi:tetratricopeptide (TPR) repeat protein